MGGLYISLLPVVLSLWLCVLQDGCHFMTIDIVEGCRNYIPRLQGHDKLIFSYYNLQINQVYPFLHCIVPSFVQLF